MDAAQQQQQRNLTAPVAPSALQGLTQHISRSVIGSIKDALESTRASLLEEAKSALAEASSDIADKASIKLRLENPTFSKLGCRQQYEHNSKVLRAIEMASQAVSKGDTEASLSALAENKILIMHRQKHVQLADREEQGWRFVAEYEKDKLADDSDDKKAIARARRAVNSKFPQSRSQRR